MKEKKVFIESKPLDIVARSFLSFSPFLSGALDTEGDFLARVTSCTVYYRDALCALSFQTILRGTGTTLVSIVSPFGRGGRRKAKRALRVGWRRPLNGSDKCQTRDMQYTERQSLYRVGARRYKSNTTCILYLLLLYTFHREKHALDRFIFAILTFTLPSWSRYIIRATSLPIGLDNRFFSYSPYPV